MQRPRRLPKSFFDRSVLAVAPELIGATFRIGDAGGMIVEVEAYHLTTASRLPIPLPGQRRATR